MEPIKFDGANAEYVATLPGFKSLPAEGRLGPSVEIVTCWKLSPEELKRVQETGKIYLSVLTFGLPFHPLIMSVDKPEPYDAQK